MKKSAKAQKKAQELDTAATMKRMKLCREKALCFISLKPLVKGCREVTDQKGYTVKVNPQYA